MAGMAISGSSARGLLSVRRDQMPAIGQRSSPVSTKVRVSCTESTDGRTTLLNSGLRRNNENTMFMGCSFLRFERVSSLAVVYPGRVYLRIENLSLS